jgi:hypothetical protein
VNRQRRIETLLREQSGLRLEAAVREGARFVVDAGDRPVLAALPGVTPRATRA